MTTRTRNQVAYLHRGTYKVNDLPNALSGPWTATKNSITDQVIKGDCGTLHIEKYEWLEPPKLSGTKRITSAYKVECSDFVGEAYYRAANLEHLPLFRPPNEALASLLAKRTNPSRPEVDVAAFVGELRELPGLLRLAGRNLITQAAGANLAYQFGWKPLIGDVKSLLSFPILMEKRAKELKRLYERGLRYTQDLYSDSGFIVKNDWITAQPYISYKGNISRATTRRVWGHIRWKPTTLPPRTDAEYMRLALKAISGMSTSSLAASAWELLPWSWLIDYFSSVGDFLQAHRNTVPAVIDELVIMEEAVTTVTFDRFSARADFPVKPVEGCKARHTTKTRASASPGIAAYLPLLSGRQISILGSLAILLHEKHRPRG